MLLLISWFMSHSAPHLAACPLRKQWHNLPPISPPSQVQASFHARRPRTPRRKVPRVLSVRWFEVWCKLVTGCYYVKNDRLIYNQSLVPVGQWQQAMGRISYWKKPQANTSTWHSQVAGCLVIGVVARKWEEIAWLEENLFSFPCIQHDGVRRGEGENHSSTLGIHCSLWSVAHHLGLFCPDQAMLAEQQRKKGRCDVLPSAFRTGLRFVFWSPRNSFRRLTVCCLQSGSRLWWYLTFSLVRVDNHQQLHCGGEKDRIMWRGMIESMWLIFFEHGVAFLLFRTPLMRATSTLISEWTLFACRGHGPRRHVFETAVVGETVVCSAPAHMHFTLSATEIEGALSHLFPCQCKKPVLICSFVAQIQKRSQKLQIWWASIWGGWWASTWSGRPDMRIIFGWGSSQRNMRLIVFLKNNRLQSQYKISVTFFPQKMTDERCSGASLLASGCSRPGGKGAPTGAFGALSLHVLVKNRCPTQVKTIELNRFLHLDLKQRSSAGSGAASLGSSVLAGQRLVKTYTGPLNMFYIDRSVANCTQHAAKKQRFLTKPGPISYIYTEVMLHFALRRTRNVRCRCR